MLVRLRRARDTMDRDYARPLDVRTLAGDAGMSVGHFQRAFKEAFGESPHAHLMTRRVERAAALLRHTDASVTDVCLAVGCSSLGSFSASFTRLMGATPTAYRALAHDDLRRVPGCVTRHVTRPIAAGRKASLFEKRR